MAKVRRQHATIQVDVNPDGRGAWVATCPLFPGVRVEGSDEDDALYRGSVRFKDLYVEAVGAIDGRVEAVIKQDDSKN